MNLNLYTLCVIYLVYSFLGWVGETVVATAKGRRFTNRGVASGPFCFVYGTAGVLITIGLNDQRTSLAALFFGSMIYATVVEWLTAKLLERIHHRRWWDYSDKKFNLDGYVCLQYSLLWGLLGRIVPPAYCIAAMTSRDISSSVIRTPEQGRGTDEHMRTGVWIIRSTTSNTLVPSPTATS